MVKLYTYGEIDDERIRIQSGPIKLLRERYQEELRKLTEFQGLKFQAKSAEREIEDYCKRIKENLTKLDHDGKRSAFEVLKVNAVATHDRVVVKGIVPSDITTIEQTSGCMYRSNQNLQLVPFRILARIWKGK